MSILLNIHISERESQSACCCLSVILCHSVTDLWIFPPVFITSLKQWVYFSVSWERGDREWICHDEHVRSSHSLWFGVVTLWGHLMQKQEVAPSPPPLHPRRTPSSFSLKKLLMSVLEVLQLDSHHINLMCSINDWWWLRRSSRPQRNETWCFNDIIWCFRSD